MSPPPEARPRDADALGLLGLARRAGRAVVGPRALKEAARSGRLAALVVAADAPRNARDRLAAVLERTGVPKVEFADRVRLGTAVGKERVVAVGVTDRELAARLVAAVDRRGPQTTGRIPTAEPGPGSRMQDPSPEEGRR